MNKSGGWWDPDEIRPFRFKSSVSILSLSRSLPPTWPSSPSFYFPPADLCWCPLLLLTRSYQYLLKSVPVLPVVISSPAEGQSCSFERHCTCLDPPPPELRLPVPTSASDERRMPTTAGPSERHGQMRGHEQGAGGEAQVATVCDAVVVTLPEWPASAGTVGDRDRAPPHGGLVSPECPQAYRRKCHGWTMPWSWGSVGGCLRSGRARKSAAYRAAVADAAAADGLDVAVTHPNTFQVREIDDLEINIKRWCQIQWCHCMSLYHTHINHYQLCRE